MIDMFNTGSGTNTGSTVGPAHHTFPLYRAAPLLALLCLLTALLTLAGTASAQEPGAGAGSAAAQMSVVAIDINTADATQLAQGLVGVGLSKAEAIVRYREQFGAFESVDELQEVKGIGAATVERNRGRIRLR